MYIRQIIVCLSGGIVSGYNSIFSLVLLVEHHTTFMSQSCIPQPSFGMLLLLCVRLQFLKQTHRGELSSTNDQSLLFTYFVHDNRARHQPLSLGSLTWDYVNCKITHTRVAVSSPEGVKLCQLGGDGFLITQLHACSYLPGWQRTLSLVSSLR